MWHKIFLKISQWEKYAEILCVILSVWGVFWLDSLFVKKGFAETTPSPSSPSSLSQPAEELLNRVIQSQGYRRNLDAKFHFETLILGKKILGHGTYQEEKQNFPRCSMRFEITYQLSDMQTAKTILLLDGANQKMWMNQNLLQLDDVRPQQAEDSRYYQIDLEKVQRFQKESKKPVPWLAPPWYGQRSLENILRGIQKNFDFYMAGRTSLPPMQASQTDDVPVYCLAGRWKKEKLETWIASRKRESDRHFFSKELDMLLTDEIPTEIRLYVDQKNYFPLRLEYWRTETRRESFPIMRLQFYDIYYNVRFTPRQFEFLPPQFTRVDDLTEPFLESNR